ncbi:MAG: lipid-A-disaccharide synthase-related protein [Xenococcaceae cyanobacterium]
MKVLSLSNGHGEDVIAVRILEQLQLHLDAPELAALPLVGEGHAYAQLDIPIIAPVQGMPSGGFIYMDGRQLWRDVRGGLLQLTLAQYKAVRKWGRSQAESGNDRCVILAVGDIVPLLFAWLSGVDYAFVGTAKSEYYLRDEAGWLPQTSHLERWFGSVYLPWERWLISHRRCKAVFPRDKLTTEILQQWSIPAFDLGNPMMDGIAPKHPSPVFFKTDAQEKERERALIVLLLPGSRAPEAEGNWQQIIEATAGVISAFKRPLVFLGAIAPYCRIDSFREHLVAQGWNSQALEVVEAPICDPKALAFTQKNATLLLTQNAYKDCLLAADLAIAMAGTATEQFVGLGKPAIAIPGSGPQFTYAFAEAQTRLLGPSLILVKHSKEVAGAIQSLLRDPDQLQLIAENGQRRMGSAGAAARIAHCLMSS